MSFEHAPVTKAMMMGLALSSIVAGIFDVKHYLHLQLVPHISKHHQYWRIFAHHLACSNSSDLFLSELLLYNTAITIERSFGSVKFSSFLVLATAINSLLAFSTMLLLHQLPYLGPTFNYLPCGPIALVFSIIFQFARLVPKAYQFRILGVSMSDKIWVYALAFQLTASYFPATLLPTLLGIITGYIYRSDILQLKGWRISHKLVNFVRNWIQPLLGGERAVRRTNRVLPETRETQTDGTSPTEGNEEVITTARRSSFEDNVQAPQETAASDATTNETDPGTTRTGVMRQWVSELAGAATGNGGGGEGTVRVPTDAEIRMLVGMFPDVERSVVLGVLQRSANIEQAAETLLASQH